MVTEPRTGGTGTPRRSRVRSPHRRPRLTAPNAAARPSSQPEPSRSQAAQAGEVTHEEQPGEQVPTGMSPVGDQVRDQPETTRPTDTRMRLARSYDSAEERSVLGPARCSSSIACRSRHRPDPSPPSRRRDPSTVRSPDPRVDRPSRPPGVRGVRRRRRAARHRAGRRPRPGRTARSARAGASPRAGVDRDHAPVLRSGSRAVTSRPVSGLIAVDAAGRPCGGPVVVAHDPVQNRARRDAPGPPADGGVAACGCAPGRLSRVRPSSS